jgi:hypothetical protein
MLSIVGDIRLNQEFVIWGIGPAVLSLVVLIAGLIARRHSRQAGSALLVLGIGGLVLSAGWIAFLFWVDAVLGDT